MWHPFASALHSHALASRPLTALLSAGAQGSWSHWPRRGRPETDGLGAQLGCYFLAAEADGIVEAIWGHQATHVRLHEYARQTQLIP